MAKFDAMADVYDASRGGLERGRHFAHELIRWLPAGDGPLLDVGAGTGAVALPLLQAGYGVLGVDLSQPMLAKAADRVPGRVCLADAVSLPWRLGAFDAAYAAWVMYHLAEPDAVLAEVARVLRPGGRFLAIDRNRRDGGSDPGAIVAEAIDRRLGRHRPVLRSKAMWFTELAAPHGLSTVGIMPTAPWREARTLRQAIENTRLRVFGWDGSEQEWVEAVEPVLHGLSQRPDVDDVVLFDQGHDILVLQRGE